MFWKSSHPCCRQSAPDKKPTLRGPFGTTCKKRLFSRHGLIYFPELYSSSPLYALCWAYKPRSHSAPVHAPTDQCTTHPAVFVGEPLQALSRIRNVYFAASAFLCSLTPQVRCSDVHSSSPFFCPFVSVLVAHGITQHEYFQGVILLPLIRDCFPIYIGYLGSTVSRTYWYCTI